MNASKREILRSVTAMKAAKALTVVDRSRRVSEMRAKIVEMTVRNNIRAATAP